MEIEYRNGHKSCDEKIYELEMKYTAACIKTMEAHKLLKEWLDYYNSKHCYWNSLDKRTEIVLNNEPTKTSISHPP